MSNDNHHVDKRRTMTPQVPVVRVGVAAVVQDAQGRMVMGIRKGSHGEGGFADALFQMAIA